MRELIEFRRTDNRTDNRTWECQVCASLISDPQLHQEWHDRIEENFKEVEKVFKAMLIDYLGKEPEDESSNENSS